ncbi:MAG: RES family NAD+ phosphorylase [candidate division KSB1 bacterium]
MEVYRIAKTRYLNDLSGSGARLFGGRWNHKGTSVIYASENRALAAVEYLVHAPLSIIPPSLSLMTLQVPDEILPEEISTSALPNNWREYPAPTRLADIGTMWAKRNQTLLLRAPSAVVEHEYNILINPLHPDMKMLRLARIEKFSLDKRLLK